MKVSVFARPDRAALLIAAAYVAAHLPSFAPSLEDFDSINFALGLRDFNPALHQPHPPGYPLYIALGKLFYMPLLWMAPDLPRATAEAYVLGLLSVIGGAVAIVAAAHVFSAINAARAFTAREDTPDAAQVFTAREVWATVLLAVSPLFWMQGLRPMSDMPGLALALVAQALAFKALGNARRFTPAAFVSGLAAGMRVQTLLLTVPLLVVVAVMRRVKSPWPAAAFGAGVLTWAVPLIAASGGVDAYLRALGTQAGEDVAFVDMLWLNPTPRRLAFVIYETFVLPWSSLPLAALVAIATAAGAVALLVRGRRSLALLVAAFVPYTAAHMLLQETPMVRYALPVVPLAAFLAASGIGALGRFSPFAAAPLAAAALIVAVPAGIAYGRAPHPAFRAIADAARHAETAPPGAVFTHFGLWRALQAESGGLRVTQPPWRYEWLGPVEYWKSGGTAPVWFLADPKRTDLALIDPRSRADVTRYEWRVANRPELNGTRPLGTNWYRIAAPGWFAGEGWSLTPETGGLARLDARGPDHRPIEAWVRRRPGPMHLVVGGRHLGAAGDPSAEYQLAVDGAVRDTWPLTVNDTNFLRFLDLPDGIPGEGDYARVTISARSAAAHGRRAETAVRQFDMQSASETIYGFGEGWHEAEYDVATGTSWRWTSDRSVLRVKGPPRAIRITLRGESPLRYFDAPPTVRVTAGRRVAGEFRPSDDFEWSVTVPADDVTRAGGAIAIETDPIYLPREAEGTSDQRRLGLRLFDTHVAPVLP